MKKYLVINAGSSSLKFKFFDTTSKTIFAAELENYKQDEYIYKTNLETKQILQKDYEYPIDFLETEFPDLNFNQEVEVIHRIVHGGTEFPEPIELTEENLEKIEMFSGFAPLHNPPAIKIIQQMKSQYPEIIQYGVFDTSFHLTNPKENYLYGLPYGYYENLGVRKYGFHGISYEFVMNQLINKNIINPKENKIIICHLGSGSSVCAIKNSESINHSFGFTPDENLIMSTRSGEVDYDAVNYIKNKLGLSDNEIEKLMNHESGLLGISGYTKDMKTLIDDYEKNERAKLAVDMYINKVIEYISQFYVELEGVDALVFTAGIGTNNATIREMIIKKLKILNIKIDKEKNTAYDGVGLSDISDADSKAKIIVCKTDEAQHMFTLITQ